MRNRWLQIPRNKRRKSSRKQHVNIDSRMEDITKPFKITGSASVPKAGYNYFLRAFSDIDVLPM